MKTYIKAIAQIVAVVVLPFVGLLVAFTASLAQLGA